MSEEHAPITCRYCGSPIEVRFIAPLNAWYPIHVHGSKACQVSMFKPYQGEAEALEAMNHRPENPSLTLEQITVRDELDAVWVVFLSTNGIYLMTAHTVKQNYCQWDVFTRRLFFSAPPTPADIAAAKERMDAQ